MVVATLAVVIVMVIVVVVVAMVVATLMVVVSGDGGHSGILMSMPTGDGEDDGDANNALSHLESN